MNKFSVFSFINIVMIILGIWIFLKDIYTSYIHGRNIVKAKKDTGTIIFWGISLIFWCILSWVNIKLYLSYRNNIINNIFTSILGIEISISNIIPSLRSLGIRENGVYKSGYFYKWSKIKSYNWTSPNTIEFKVSTFLKINSSFEFTIDEETKPKVDEVIQRNIAL
ncbi:DUF5673 domain-containing protein [Clostridium beijerinckii]|uniref:DUF5673 domain-containing protein n=1 Tax=Clostridium beijerinckii TaxID=1520 RepID=A0A7X9XRS7_CLOBE|nr:DUF5673 domain-containing protein [Clostridium beijerinckii]MCI1586234.1 DUF5673 domain-containing protein [Clostridium beijerinckii]MCI1623252.1 DUF5673 domain-containing protein [Clostridium beijerinckii]NMF07834.1 hypothetical protein [Clostridium beijerinckii]